MSEEKQATGRLAKAIKSNHAESGRVGIIGKNALEKQINRNRIACGKQQLDAGFKSKNEEDNTNE